MVIVCVQRFTSLLCLVTVGVLTLSGNAQKLVEKRSDHWVSTWATAQELAPVAVDPPQVPVGVVRPNFNRARGGGPRTDVPGTLENQTIRMIVHTTIGGSKVRVQISNAFGKKPLVIGAASFALRKSESEIDEATLRPLTFGGRSSITVQPGVLVLSDALIFELKPLCDIAISLFVSKDSGAPTAHTLGLHTSYISKGDTTTDAAIAQSTTTLAYLWLSSVDVVASPKAFAIVALGDSITDGFKATPDANQAWPTLLANRFNTKGTVPVSVLNQGISGNEVLRDGAGVSALARFDRDVLSRPGVKWMILLEGINDINLHGQITGPTALSAEELIFGYKQLIERAHSHGIKVMGATVMPEEGVWLATETGEAKRREVNRWIRTSGEFDSVVDFDEVVRDPTHPSCLKPEFNPGDNIHPNDLGNKAMADKFDLSVFKN